MRGTQTINEKGHLVIGGVDTTQLVEKYGTPLYVYDVDLINQNIQRFKEAFEPYAVNWQIAYASKAFSTLAMIQLVKEHELSLDVVSGGELYTALKAGFPASRIHFHGNNKSVEEIQMAIRAGIGAFVVDNFYELAMLEEEAQKEEIVVNVLLRLTPGVEAHTHAYVTTGQEDSKFGFTLSNGDVEKAIQLALNAPHIHLLGVHSHIGSQIFDAEGFVLATTRILARFLDWKDTFGYTPKVLNVGGGFGIKYTEEDDPLPLESQLRPVLETILAFCQEHSLQTPEVWIEPGRSIVGEAGTTLYKLGSSKTIPGVRKYVSVDGGMTDNIRPSLYGAKYEAVIANRADEPNVETVSVAGKCCESGDMLIWDLPLPTPAAGDVLAVFCTGAYGYSMANNYNRIGRPAVIFVENEKDYLVVERETYEDLIKKDLLMPEMVKQRS
ncbi:diaminopimelate decarboxylase [Pullulanibacillus sp. KACC 23026]|uniref:diaminopimelate decarboxylase n=1 Tax=Pullulanibacillus sp. KACC 23026 TaxID=3028315 RepID=UPI0023B204E6|nr:diaminopimelate decarboxylase [Pullulanibacillus sp. KACC 23026]WEG11437.1 diaminopimelate decarboxylase [Pullulanibacillus sp. KACC 23026]